MSYMFFVHPNHHINIPLKTHFNGFTVFHLNISSNLEDFHRFPISFHRFFHAKSTPSHPIPSHPEVADLASSIFGSFVAVTGDAHQAKVAQDIFRQQVRCLGRLKGLEGLEG